MYIRIFVLPKFVVPVHSVLEQSLWFALSESRKY